VSEDVYHRLGERLNENQVKLLLLDQFLEIQRKYCTEDQAAVGAEFPLGSHKVGPLARPMGRDETDLLGVLEGMADEGLVFTLRQEDNQRGMPQHPEGLGKGRAGTQHEQLPRGYRLCLQLLRLLLRDTGPAQTGEGHDHTDVFQLSSVHRARKLHRVRRLC